MRQYNCKINVHLYKNHIIFIFFKPNSKYFLTVDTKVVVYGNNNKLPLVTSHRSIAPLQKIQHESRHFFDKRGYPASVVQAGHHRAQQIDRQSALQIDYE